MANRSTLRIMTFIGATLTGLAVPAGINAQAEEQGVTVCMESGVAQQESDRAQVIAEKMFARIGIKIDWHKENKCPTGIDGVIHIALTTGIPANRFPGSLATALPYERVHIQVFADRPRRLVPPQIMPTLLAHEITHILQGISRHSEYGVMKATWGPRDYEKMAWKPLSFTDEDIMLIHHGLDARVRSGVQIGQLTVHSIETTTIQSRKRG